MQGQELFTSVIRNKRDGGVLSPSDIDEFVDGLADGSLPAEQVSALAMAIFIHGMNIGESARLTRGMKQSGVVLDWSKKALDGPVLDKHSTGGVGDKVSFMLAPILAACGAYVPMIAGRGLGHTGGTIDKIESIPGYKPLVSLEQFENVVGSTGCAIIGQTDQLAPADGRLYAIRDVTGTVESIPLITASILSKKLAAGLGGLVMDVKVGNGAFMDSRSQAVQLAKSLIDIGGVEGLGIVALMTDMNEVLGTTAGNALEIREAVRYLRNDEREERLDAVTRALCAELLVLGKLENGIEGAHRRVETAIDSGHAADKFNAMVCEMGGPSDFIETFDRDLPRAENKQPIFANHAGVISTVDTRAIGDAVIVLGGGRRRLTDLLDLSVGLSEFRNIGDPIDAETPVCWVHANNSDSMAQATAMVRDAVGVSSSAEARRPILDRMAQTGEHASG